MSRLPAVLTRVVLLLIAVLVPVLFPSGMPGRPDLVLLVVAVAALVHGPWTGVLVGLAGGWLVDLVPPGLDLLSARARPLHRLGGARRRSGAAGGGQPAAGPGRSRGGSGIHSAHSRDGRACGGGAHPGRARHRPSGAGICRDGRLLAA